MRSNDDRGNRRPQRRKPVPTTDIAIPVGLSYTLDYGLVIDAR
ncbi:MAG: hypothetical protein ACLUEV_00100 [Alistipes sp.]